MTWRPYFLSYVIFSGPAPDRKYGAPINSSVFLGIIPLIPTPLLFRYIYHQHDHTSKTHHDLTIIPYGLLIDLRYHLSDT